ncbi:hypothetical protein VTH06DRAFT_3540 [Thermothelomyces fergusii]
MFVLYGGRTTDRAQQRVELRPDVGAWPCLSALHLYALQKGGGNQCKISQFVSARSNRAFSAASPSYRVRNLCPAWPRPSHPDERAGTEGAANFFSTLRFIARQDLREGGRGAQCQDRFLISAHPTPFSQPTCQPPHQKSINLLHKDEKDLGRERI